MNRQSELLKNIDWLSIFLYTLLVFMGWLNIYAAVYDESHSNILDIDLKYGKQLLWIGADFTVLRDGQTVELPDVQFDTWTDEAGQVHMSLGFTVYGLAKTPRNVLREAGNSMLYYGRIIFTSLADLLRGRESINNLSGPVGIVTAIGQAASYGWQDLLQLLALITINLGIFNLLPFPALDGGKVVFLAIEGITGHAVPEKLQGSLTVAAFALLFGLMIFATYNDIIRLITGAV